MKNNFIGAIAAAAFATVGHAAFASTFTLDFGSTSARSFNNAAGNYINYGVVANDGSTNIYARLTTLNAFSSATASNNGSAAGDLRVNARRGESVQLKLELFSDASYATSYTNASSFDWTLLFYDVDGISDDVNGYGANLNETNYYDEVLMRTEGVATFTEDTELNYSMTADGLLVNAEGAGSVSGQQGLTSLSAEQQNYAFAYTVSNTSTLFFDYNVQDLSFTSRARNLLVDGGSLEITEDSFDVNVSAVPLPAGAPMLIVGMGALAALRRRRT